MPRKERMGQNQLPDGQEALRASEMRSFAEPSRPILPWLLPVGEPSGPLKPQDRDRLELHAPRRAWFTSLSRCVYSTLSADGKGCKYLFVQYVKKFMASIPYLSSQPQHVVSRGSRPRYGLGARQGQKTVFRPSLGVACNFFLSVPADLVCLGPPCLPSGSILWGTQSALAIKHGSRGGRRRQQRSFHPRLKRKMEIASPRRYSKAVSGWAPLLAKRCERLQNSCDWVTRREAIRDSRG